MTKNHIVFDMPYLKNLCIFLQSSKAGRLSSQYSFPFPSKLGLDKTYINNPFPAAAEGTRLGRQSRTSQVWHARTMGAIMRVDKNSLPPSPVGEAFDAYEYKRGVDISIILHDGGWWLVVAKRLARWLAVGGLLSILPRGGWESFFYCKKNCFNNTALGHRTTFDNVSPASEGMSSDRITKAIIRKPAPGIENVPRAIILLIIIQMNSRASARMVLLHRVCVWERENLLLGTFTYPGLVRHRRWLALFVRRKLPVKVGQDQQH